MLSKKEKLAHVCMAAALLLLFGCAWKEPYVTRTHELPDYKQVGVAVFERNVSITNNVDVGTLQSAAGYFVECVIELGTQIAVGAPYPSGFGAVPGFIFIPFVCPVAAVYGGVKGTMGAIEHKRVTKKQGTVDTQVSAEGMIAHVRDATVGYTRAQAVDAKGVNIETLLEGDYAALASNGINAVIEFNDLELSFKQVDLAESILMMTLQAKSRLVDTESGKSLKHLNLKGYSNFHDYRAWTADDFRRLEEEYAMLIETVVSATIDEYLFLYYPTLGAQKEVETQQKMNSNNTFNFMGTDDEVYEEDTESIATQRHFPYYVLGGVEPKAEFTGWGKMGNALEIPVGSENRRQHGKAFSFNVVLELEDDRPLFKWEAFPWEHDSTDRTSFSEIVYDFEIYMYKGVRVYARKGLKENQHRIETPLEKGQTYLWSVRARFKHDGKTNVTEWGSFYRFVKDNEKARHLPDYPRFYGYYPFMIED